MKRNALIYVILTVLLASLLSVSVLAADEEASDSSFFEINGIAYEDGNTGFVYSDDLLLNNSSEMSGDLCKVSAILSCGAYRQNDITNMLQQIGYTVTTDGYNSKSDDFDLHHIAFAIGKKVRDDGKILYIVAVRGSVGVGEWISDFCMDLPKSGSLYGVSSRDHIGFREAADNVAKVLEPMIRSDGASGFDRYILFTGHSRGAAVANFLAADYSGYLVPVGHVFGYTFACPNVSVDAYAGDYPNIFNFNNTSDVVPLVPLSEWGYGRHGIDYPFTFSSNPVFSMVYYSEFESESGSSPKTMSYQEAIKTMHEVAEGNDSLSVFGLMLLGWKTGADDVKLSDVLDYGKDVFKESFADDVQYQKILLKLTVDIELRGFYNLLANEVNIYREEKAFLEESIAYWNEQEDTSQESVDQWLEDHERQISGIEEETGRSVKSLEDLAPTLSYIRDDLIPAALRVAKVIGIVRDIVNINVVDNHAKKTYLDNINAKYLGYCAFKNLSGLSSVSVPSCVKTIGYNCFFGSDLASISQTEQLEYISSYAFNNCTELSGLQLRDCYEIGAYAFYNCASMKTLDLGNTVSSIGTYAFYGCKSLENLYIPDSVKTLGMRSYQGPFFNCTGLKTISIGGVETLTSGMLRTGSTVLESLTIRGTVKNIGASAFDSTGSGVGSESYYYNNNNYNGYGYTSTTPLSLVIEEGIETIGTNAFYNCHAFTSISIPSTVTSFGDNAFYDCKNAEMSLDLRRTITKLGASSFYNCAKLDMLKLGDVEEIGASAFYNCASMKTLDLGNTVSSIGTYAFYGCKSLENLYIPDSVKTLGMRSYQGPFFNCTGLKTISIGGVETLTSGMLRTGSTVLESLTIRGTVKNIGASAFDSTGSGVGSESYYYNNNNYNGYGYTSTTPLSLVIEEGIETIGTNAFYNCHAFTSISIPSTVTSIGHNAFYDCKNAEMDLILENAEEIGAYAFYNCAKLMSIDLGSKVTSIGASSFYSCKLIQNLSVPASVKTIGASAFSGCTGITEVTFSEGLETLGGSSFYNCSSLKTLRLPASAASIDLNAFNGCRALADVYYGGSEVMRNNRTGNGWSTTGNSPLFNALWHYAVNECAEHTPGEPVRENEVPATCTEEGSYEEVMYCSRCEAEISRETKTISALDHEWDEGVITTEPTCTEPGVMTYTCKRDETHTKTEEIPLAEHTVVIDPAVEATEDENGLTEGSHCSVCGEVLVPQEVVPALKHTVVIDPAVPATCEEDGLTEGSHCADCDEIFKEQTVIPALGHDWDEGTITTEPTCTEPGTKTYTCSRDETHTKTEEIPALGHTEVVDPAVPATCEEAGLTEGSHCADCDEVFKEQTVIPALGHDWDEGTVTTEPTCVKPGVKTYTCRRDNTHTYTEEITALDHTVVTDAGTPATCEEAGLTEGSHCSVCGEVLTVQEVIPALGHDWDEGVVTKEATCSEAGVISYTCKRDAGHTTTEEIPKTEHTVVIDPAVAPTETSTGLTEGSHCSVCGEIIKAQEVIPVLSPVTQFSDVTDTASYYYDPVYWAAANGITTGTSDTTFSPNASCTRGQIVTFLWRAYGSPEPTTASTRFKDIKAGAYYYKAVLWAVENNITTGTSATTFAPNAVCTRGQIVTFLWRAEGKPRPASSSNPFKDIKKSDYFYDAVLWAVGKGITTGTSATTFSPNATCSRGQCVTFLWRAKGSSAP